jgi:ABC-type Fe3+-hydroxamate transport system substrate-binding protein
VTRPRSWLTTLPTAGSCVPRLVAAATAATTLIPARSAATLVSAGVLAVSLTASRSVAEAGPSTVAEAAPSTLAEAAPSSVAEGARSAKPQRVASINLSADEVLVEILPLERLVSVTRWADDADNSNVVGRIPASIHRFAKRDLEQLVALRPDLAVVSEYTDADFLKLLERSGLRVHRMQGLSTLAGIRAAILDLGRAVGEEAGAQRVVRRYDAVLGELGRRLAGAKKPRVLY